MKTNPTLEWMLQGSPDVSGDFSKNWRNEGSRPKKRFYHAIAAVVYLFVREALQNMKDAWANKKFRAAVARLATSFKVTARFVTYHKGECEHILQALGLDDELLEFLEQQEDPADEADAAAWRAYKKRIREIRKRQTLTVLYMEEQDASGMFVDPKTGRDGLLAAMYSHNQGNPQKGAGGSYGHGKGAIAKASRLKTNVAYTNTDWCQSPHNENRLMGVTYMPSFSTQSAAARKRYSGFGLLTAGTRRDPDINGVVPVPFVGSAADTKAVSLGMRRRGAGDHGTTMMIVDPDFSPAEFKRAASLYWLPAILSKSLQIEVVEEVCGHPSKPAARAECVDPRGEESLRGFCAAQDLLLGVEPIPAPTASRVYEAPGLGKLAAVAFHYEPVAVDTGLSSTAGSVVHVESQIALSRSRGIGMVVAHTHRVAALPHGVDVRAHFEADPAVEDVLRASEPKAHDAWVKDELSPAHRSILNRIEEHIKDSLTEFLIELRGSASDDGKTLDVASEAWSKIGAHIGKQPPKRPPANSTSRRKSPVKIEFADEGELDGHPTIGVLVSAEKITVLVEGSLCVLDDSGTTVASFPADSVQVAAGAKDHRIQFKAADDSNGDLRLGDAVARKYPMRWAIDYSILSEGEGQ